MVKVFEKLTISQTFLVVNNIEYPVILGHDFLSENLANIDYPTRTLYLNDGSEQVALINSIQNKVRTNYKTAI